MPPAIAAAANVTVDTLVNPNTTVNGLVSTALLDDAAYVAAPVTVTATTINISVTAASGSVLVSLQSFATLLCLLCTIRQRYGNLSFTIAKLRLLAWYTLTKEQLCCHPDTTVLIVLLLRIGHDSTTERCGCIPRSATIALISSWMLPVLQANISASQEPLLVNTTSPLLTQTTTSVNLPSSEARVLVQFNSLADTATTADIPQDVSDLNEVVNSTYFSNVDTHVLNLDNSTVNASTFVSELRARDGTLHAVCT